MYLFGNGRPARVGRIRHVSQKRPNY